jgi:hypothetical protein
MLHYTYACIYMHVVFVKTMHAMTPQTMCEFACMKCLFPRSSQWKHQLYHELAFGGHRGKKVVKRTVMGKQLRFFFTMFSTSDM